MKKKKKLWRFILIGFVALIILLVIAKKAGWIGSEPLTEIYTEKVTVRTIVETVSANGKIQPEVEVKISPDVSGEIVDIFVKEGDKVQRGDILAKINPDIYLSNLDQIAASVNQQKAALANARARQSQAEAQFIVAETNYNRNTVLKDRGAISEAELENIRSQYLVAKAEVEAAEQSIIGAEFSVKSAEAALKEAQDNLTKTSIFAPMDGTVSKVSYKKGERVAGASQFSPGTEIIRISDLSRMEVKVDVNENDIIRVNLGDTADIEIDAYLNQKFKGVVVSIANSANVSGLSIDQVTNFEVIIKILPESYAHLIEELGDNIYPFRPGMSATVDIMTTRIENVMSLPIQSVTTRQDTLENLADNEMKAENTDESENESESEVVGISNQEEIKEYVFVYENGTVKLQEIKTGIQDSYFIEIKEGLELGQEVVSGPYRAVSRNLKNGDKVKKVDKDKIKIE
ncbi:MAG: efflux RND transporter periplasmic adaptor subunit [Bacteroidales bacterium]|nr:efflux RND transporter periplasmic adaptor subunit [Bacteroidales bacterium]